MQDKRGEQKQLFRDVFLKRSKYLQSKQSLKEREVYVLIHDFFKEFLSVDYEFTEQELKEELKKVYLEALQRKRSEELLSKAFKIQYSDSTLSENELRNLLKDFNRLVMHLIKNDKKQPVLSSLIGRITGKTKLPQIDHVPPMPPGFNKQILPKPAVSHEPASEIKEAAFIDKNQQGVDTQDIKEEPVKTIISRIKIIEDDHKGEEKAHINWTDDEPAEDDKKSQWADEIEGIISGKPDTDKEKQITYSDAKESDAKELIHRKKAAVSPSDRMNELLNETTDAVSTNIEKAKKLYKQMHLIYSNLDPKTKAEYYQQVHDIYASIHKAHSEKHV